MFGIQITYPEVMKMGENNLQAENYFYITYKENEDDYLVTGKRIIASSMIEALNKFASFIGEKKVKLISIIDQEFQRRT